MNRSFFTLPLLVLLVFSSSVAAHSGGNSFIQLQMDETHAEGEWYLSLLDIELALGLDRNGDGEVTAAEFQQSLSRLTAYADKNFQILNSDKLCVLIWKEISLRRLSDGVYARLPFVTRCEISALNYKAMFDLDANHRAIVYFGDEAGAMVLSPMMSSIPVSPSFKNRLNMVWEGMVHIWIGYDHLLFLFALIVPLLLRRESFVSSLLNLAKVITAFTLGHSITLVLAALSLITLPASLIEFLIAFSVVIAGLNIVCRWFSESAWCIALIFGLIHGFGFANVLQPLLLSQAALASALLQFNVGVELGQLAVVALLVPIFWWVARYAKWITCGRWVVAVTIAGVGVFWSVQRSGFIS